MRDQPIRDEKFNQMIDNSFANHVIQDEPVVRSWKIKKPDTWAYSYTVTWTPGHLTISGDIGECAFTHWAAMRDSWEQARDWVRESDIDYLLGKSNARREYNYEASVRQLIEIADEDQHGWGDAVVWRSIFEYLGKFYHRDYGYMECVVDEDQHQRNIKLRRVHKIDLGDELWYRNKAHQSKVIKYLLDSEGQYNAGDLYWMAGGDFGGVEEWPARAIWHAKAIKLWANLVSKEPLEVAA